MNRPFKIGNAIIDLDKVTAVEKKFNTSDGLSSIQILMTGAINSYGITEISCKEYTERPSDITREELSSTFDRLRQLLCQD